MGKVLTVGVKEVVCTCGGQMKRTGGVFGEIFTDTFYCYNCQKHVVIVTPSHEEQEEFAERMK